MSILVMLTACSPSGPQHTPSPSAVPSPFAVDGHATINGSLLLAIGAAPGRASLYRYDPAGKRFERLTPPGYFVDFVTIAGKTTVVSGIGGGFGAASISTLGAGNVLQPVHLPLPADATADCPAGRPDGVFAYCTPVAHVVVPHQVINYTGELRVHDLMTGGDHVLVSAQPDLGSEAWGPSGALVFQESDYAKHQYAVKLLESNGTVRTLVTFSNSVGLTWDASGRRPIAMGGGTNSVRTVILDPASGKQLATLSGWAPIAWYGQSGDNLLVASGSVIGLWDITHDKPAKVGTVTDGGLVFSGVWSPT